MRSRRHRPLHRYFGITQRAERTDSGSPEDAKLDLILSRITSVEQGARTEQRRSGAIGGRKVPSADEIRGFHRFLSQFEHVRRQFDGKIDLRDYDLDARIIVFSGPVDVLEKQHLEEVIVATLGDGYAVNVVP